MIIKPTIFDSHIIKAAQSTRHGGVSEAPYYSLNLGKSTSDNPLHVLENRRRFFEALQTDNDNVAMSGQVHGTEILLAHQPVMEKGYDAIISNTPGLLIVVSIADCVPVLIHDTTNNAVAAIHAGWKGTASGIVTKTLQRMQEVFNTNGNDCFAFIGACIGYDAFEVDEDVARHFKADVKKYNDVKHKYYVDLKSENKNQLLKAGLSAENAEISEYCTVTNNDLFFSHRKEKGVTGRMMAAIGIK